MEIRCDQGECCSLYFFLFINVALCTYLSYGTSWFTWTSISQHYIIEHPTEAALQLMGLWKQTPICTLTSVLRPHKINEWYNINRGDFLNSHIEKLRNTFIHNTCVCPPRIGIIEKTHRLKYYILNIFQHSQPRRGCSHQIQRTQQQEKVPSYFLCLICHPFPWTLDWWTNPIPF